MAFTAVLQFNPIIIGITAVVGVVALLASTFESVSEKASDALEKIKAVPEAMGKNEQAALTARLNQLDIEEADYKRRKSIYMSSTPEQQKGWRRAISSTLITLMPA
ncbi:hypothetical protein [Klebsiella pneumoniae]|uniref:hypothetical protein n=1 Tax=Klebsiella pneumoniae TaxID=573 RepID=UPI000F61B391|nr:hypothetical protein [Klebsiella pneumoniae]RRF43527.1 hypothetical protein EAO12_29805 [Klebsiella pneumoniae]